MCLPAISPGCRAYAHLGTIYFAVIFIADLVNVLTFLVRYHLLYSAFQIMLNHPLFAPHAVRARTRAHPMHMPRALIKFLAHAQTDLQDVNASLTIAHVLPTQHSISRCSRWILDAGLPRSWSRA